jgi:hypothetical protein
MNEQFYDVVDSEGNVVETAEQQAKEATGDVLVVDAFEKPKEITPFEIRKLNKLYVTFKHPKVIACEHRLDLSKQPQHRNCEHCWMAWFQNHGEIVQQLDEMYQNHGEKLIVQLQGKKFYHRWRQFMSTVAQWQQVGEVNEQVI